MSDQGLSDEEIHTLDTVLNYTQGERIEPDINEKTLDDISEFVERETTKDDYSNQYTIYSIKSEKENEVKSIIDETCKVDQKNRIDELRTFFGDNTDAAFQFYNSVKSTDDRTVRLSGIDVDQIHSFLNPLLSGGYGVIQTYTTTTNNQKYQFAFRTYPFDGRSRFQEEASVVIKDQLSDLSDLEIWTAYANSYLQYNDVLRNRGGHPREKIEEALDSGKLELHDEIPALRNRVQTRLQSELYDLLNQDTFYLTVLETLKGISRERGETLRIEKDYFDHLSGNQQERMQAYIDDLLVNGLVFEESNLYMLTPEVVSVLDTLEDRSKIESYPIQTPEQRSEILEQILSEADQEIKVIDRFFDDVGLDILNSAAPSQIRKMILYEKEGDARRTEKISNTLRKNRVLDHNYELRWVRSDGPDGLPHDRFIILDNEKVWQVGHSLNGLGGSFSTLFAHSERNTAEYVSVFDDHWSNAEKL